MDKNDDIFQGNDDESLLMHVIEKITSAQDFDIHKVSDEHRDVVAVITAQAVIDNGGFRYFFESHLNGDSDYQLFVNAYKNIGATESADAINQALMMFPGGVPPEELSERQKYLDSIFDASTDNKKKIDAMEDKILGKVENYSRVANYIRENKKLFN